MWMTTYIKEIQRQFIEVYGFPPHEPPLSAHIPPGVYPMTIEGKIDYVCVTPTGHLSVQNRDAPTTYAQSAADLRADGASSGARALPMVQNQLPEGWGWQRGGGYAQRVAEPLDYIHYESSTMKWRGHAVVAGTIPDGFSTPRDAAEAVDRVRATQIDPRSR